MAHFNLANVRRESSDLDAAAAGYAQALSLNPAMHDARLALAGVQRMLGKFDAALATYLALLERQPGNSRGLTGLASVLRFAPVAGHRPELCALIEQCFAEPAVQAQDLAAAAALQLRGKYGLDDDCADVESLVGQVEAEPLLYALLTRTINVDPVLERFLTRLRAHLAGAGETAPSTSSRLRLVVAIALQCFINEYVFASSSAEDQAIARRRARVERQIAEPQQPVQQRSVSLR